MKKALDYTIKGVCIILRVLLIVTVVLIGCQVFCRYVLKSPLLWTEQLCRMFFIWMMLLGIPVLFYKKDIMRFDMILDKMPEHFREIVEIIINVLTCSFSAFWSYGSVTLILGTYKKMTSGVRVPYALLYVAQTVSAVLLFWVVAQQLVVQIQGLVTKRKRRVV